MHVRGVEIERLLAYSGTFRDVRTYRLQSTPTLTLSNESGTAIKLDSMRDPVKLVGNGTAVLSDHVPVVPNQKG